MSPDVAASIKARLLTKAKASGEAFELFLVRYACERFLYRLGASDVRERCVLKGAGLLAIWLSDPYRATRDVDFLTFGSNDEESIRNLVERICETPCPEDAMQFDLGSLEIAPIQAEDEYQGKRAILRAYLGTARIKLQIDFGTGDSVVPGPEESEQPTLIKGLPAPRIRTYPRVVSVAEKFEAIVQLGRRNSRMKDFHDIWALSSLFSFSGPELQDAVRRCFERRGTVWTSDEPDALKPEFYLDDDMAMLWTSYRRAGAHRVPPPENFATVGEALLRFLGPVRDSILAVRPFEMHWSSDGSWVLKRAIKNGVNFE